MPPIPEPVLSVDVVATAPIALSGLQTIDGVALRPGMSALVTAQPIASQNGTWTVSGTGWNALEVVGNVFVRRGTSHTGTIWNLASGVWTQGSAAGQGLASASGALGLSGSVSENVVAAGGAAQTLSPVASAIGNDITLSANCTITMPTAARGAYCYARLHQAATGGPYTATFTGVRWAGGIVPTMTITASAIDLYEFQSDGTHWFNVTTAQALA